MTRRKWRVLLAALLVAATFPVASGAADAAAYRVSFRGVPERRLRAILEEVSDAVAQQDRPPPTEALLLRRGQRDVPRLLDVLRADGYYAARIEVRLAGTPPRRMVFEITPGPRYRVGRIDLDTGVARAPRPVQIGLARGTPARASFIKEAEERLLQEVRGQGYPFPRLTEQHYRVKRDRARLDVSLRVDPGRAAVFGVTSVTGLVLVKEAYLRDELEWGRGEPYRPKLLDDTRTKLTRSSLFSAVNLATAPAVEEDGSLPVSLQLRERRRRTVAFGVGYRTDEGAGTSAEWEHRNLFGGAERLRLEASFAEFSRSVDANFRKPHFFQRNQDLVLDLRAAEDRPDAYDSRSVRAAAMWERHWGTELSARAGTAFRHSTVDQLDEQEQFILLSLPTEVDWNTSDDPLDPRRGGRLFAGVEPFYDLLSRDIGFVKSRLSGNRYLALNREATWVLAGRAYAGSILGAGQTTVPADERFYAGGGSSIRGYAYESVGPLQENNDPLGGRSLAEVSVELRAHLTASFGVVAFLDGGTAFASAVPDFHENLQWGTGLGVRYFTPVGPLRADVGVPLDQRPGIDKDFQVYVSIGQAF